MLNSFRSLSERKAFKLLLWVIVVAFLTWGINDVLSRKRLLDVIEFDYATNITYQSYNTLKTQYIQALQQNYGINISELSDQELKGLEIEHKITKDLVDYAMVRYFANYYGLQVSDGIVELYENGYYKIEDIESSVNSNFFKRLASFGLTYDMEKEEYIRNRIQDQIIYSIFINDIYSNKLSTEQEKYAFEEREFDLYYLDMSSVISSMNTVFSQEELEDFYNENKNRFYSNEKREVKAVIIDRENSDSDKWYELVKHINDDISAGNNIEEISEKYKKEIITESVVINAPAQKTKLSEIHKNVFEVSQNDVNFANVFENESKMIVYAVTKVAPSKPMEFAEVKNKVIEEYKKKVGVNNINEALSEFVSEYNKSSSADSNNVANIIKKYGIKKKSDQKISRLTSWKQNVLPNMVVENLFEMDTNNLTSPYVDEHIAYVCHLKKIKQNPNQEDMKTSKVFDQVHKEIKERSAITIVDNIIKYLSDFNNTRINIDD